MLSKIISINFNILRLLLAEREGFEPPIRLPVCRISSAVHSTTLPPLHPIEIYRYFKSESAQSGVLCQIAPAAAISAAALRHLWGAAVRCRVIAAPETASSRYAVRRASLGLAQSAAASETMCDGAGSAFGRADQPP